MTIARSFRHLLLLTALVLGAFAPSTAFAICGDGETELEEQCDDGNVEDGDCCSKECQLDPNGTPCTDDFNQCTRDVCNGEGTCNNIIQQGQPCDDGNGCSVGDTCNSDGFCSPEGFLEEGSLCFQDDLCGGRGSCNELGQGSTFCFGDPASCDGFGDPCHSAVCDPESAQCEVSELPDGTICSEAGTCTAPGECAMGECIAGPRDCSEFEDDCNDSACDPERGGCVAVPKQGEVSCDDDAGCTVNDHCVRGFCVGDERDCSHLNTACQVGICNGDLGDCEADPLEDDTVCNDGNPCTQKDRCQNGQCIGDLLDCSDLSDQCNVGTCNPQNGECFAQPVEAPTLCNDGDLCTTGDRCIGGLCIGNPTDCSGLDGQCTEGVCNPDTGSCQSIPANEGGECDDGNLCTGSDSCTEGSCNGSSKGCSEFTDQCNIGGCVASTGQCASIPRQDGTVCNDGDPCTDSDQCSDGECAGTPKDCSSLDDECHTGTCGRAGSCVAVEKQDGTACSDGFLCTVGDQCTAGVCAGTTKDCTDFTDQCNIGGCIGATGDCASIPRQDGTECSDGNLCTVSDQCSDGDCAGTARDCSEFDDACHTGTCVAQTGQCTATEKQDGTTCDDGDPCTVSDQCGDGICDGTPKDCSSLDNQCNLGSCSRTGDCIAVPRQDETPCNDGSLCTTGDHCVEGSCVGTTKDCSDFTDQCNTGGCIANTGNCASLPRQDGTACNDGDLCTVSDQCSDGDCAGSPKDCSGSGGGCLTGSCNPDNGNCVGEEAEDGTLCNDGNPCTVSDACTDGTCSGSPKDCSSLDGACVVGVCTQPNGACGTANRENGTSCSDSNECTSGDQCTGGVCTSGTPTDCSNLDGPCQTGVCNTRSGLCEAEAAGNGTPCSDGAFCTQTDTCQGGTCVGSGNPCATGGECANTCNEAGDTCNDPAGTPCTSDGNPCTDDICDGAGNCDNEINEADCDDGLFCTSGDHCADGACIGDPTCPPFEGCSNTCSESEDSCRSCGHPFSNERCIVNAIFVLQGALGLRVCEPCTCDVDSSGTVTVTDALHILRTCTNLPSQLNCPEPATTTTTIGI